MFDELIKQDRPVKRQISSQGKREPIKHFTKCWSRESHGPCMQWQCVWHRLWKWKTTIELTMFTASYWHLPVVWSHENYSTMLSSVFLACKMGGRSDKFLPSKHSMKAVARWCVIIVSVWHFHSFWWLAIIKQKNA